MIRSIKTLSIAKLNVCKQLAGIAMDCNRFVGNVRYNKPEEYIRQKILSDEILTTQEKDSNYAPLFTHSTFVLTKFAK